MRQRWKPPAELPSLTGVKKLAIDTETTGKNKRKDTPIGISCRTDDGRTFYLPFSHTGGNLDPAAVLQWGKTEVKDKHVIGLNTGFDAEVLLRWGIDLEAQGCTLRDVAHTAALLNENRYKGFNL